MTDVIIVKDVIFKMNGSRGRADRIKPCGVVLRAVLQQAHSVAVDDRSPRRAREGLRGRELHCSIGRYANFVRVMRDAVAGMGSSWQGMQMTGASEGVSVSTVTIERWHYTASR